MTQTVKQGKAPSVTERIRRGVPIFMIVCLGVAMLVLCLSNVPETSEHQRIWKKAPFFRETGWAAQNTFGFYTASSESGRSARVLNLGAA